MKPYCIRKGYYPISYNGEVYCDYKLECKYRGIDIHIKQPMKSGYRVINVNQCLNDIIKDILKAKIRVKTPMP